MAIAETVRALGVLDEAAEELRAVRDRLATLLYRFEVSDQAWLVPPEHRPTCPLDQKPCTHWSCLVDVCVDAKKERGAKGEGRE